MLRVAVSLVVGLAAAGAVLVGIGSSADLQASRVIDRTVTCATGIQGGLRQLTIQASSRAGERSGYVWALTNVQPTGRVATVSQSGLELSPFCKPTRVSVPLTSRGLEGSVASAFDDEWDCQVPRRVLLRVRAVFKGVAPRLRRGDPWGFPILFAHRPVTEGTLAVRTPAGKQVALARLLRTGKIQVLTSGVCFPD